MYNIEKSDNEIIDEELKIKKNIDERESLEKLKFRRKKFKSEPTNRNSKN
jgi:hypothetical protein